MVIKTLIDALFVTKETLKLTRFVVLSPFGVLAAALMGLSLSYEG